MVEPRRPQNSQRLEGAPSWSWLLTLHTLGAIRQRARRIGALDCGHGFANIIYTRRMVWERNLTSPTF